MEIIDIIFEINRRLDSRNPLEYTEKEGIEDSVYFSLLDFIKSHSEKQASKELIYQVGVRVDADAGHPYLKEIELWDYYKEEPLAKEGDRFKVVLTKM